MSGARKTWTLALLLIAGWAHGAVTHSLLPWKAQAGKAFDLMLAGDYACNTVFSRESTTVSTGGLTTRIMLAFLATEIHTIDCVNLPQPHGPTFKLPALAAGTYPVYSQSLEPCMVEPATCDRADPVHVGTLSVTTGAAYDTGWFLHPKRVESGKDVRVGLLNLARGSCENAFNPARDTVRFKITELSFYTRNIMIGSICPTSVHPFGPEFRLGDLEPGSYRVEGYDLPACAFQNPPCLPIVPYLPVVVDTLVVGSTTALGPIPERPAGSAPRLRRLPGGLGLVWPGREAKDPGLKIERIVTPDGRRVAP